MEVSINIVTDCNIKTGDSLEDWLSGKESPAMQGRQETQVQSVHQEDPLEKKMTAHSSILAWETPWTEEPGRLQSMRSQRVGHNLVTEQQ